MKSHIFSDLCFRNRFSLFLSPQRRWLDALLPEDAHVQCSGRVTVVITHVPSLGLRGISQFESKADLIEALMASVHVPFVIDWRPLASYRGELGAWTH